MARLHEQDIPRGWRIEPFAGSIALISDGGCVTIDFEHRAYRPGLSGMNYTIATRKYRGRGWRQNLVADAIRWLTVIEQRTRAKKAGA